MKTQVHDVSVPVALAVSLTVLLTVGTWVAFSFSALVG